MAPLLACLYQTPDFNTLAQSAMTKGRAQRMQTPSAPICKPQVHKCCNAAGSKCCTAAGPPFKLSIRCTPKHVECAILVVSTMTKTFHALPVHLHALGTQMILQVRVHGAKWSFSRASLYEIWSKCRTL
jgi:hypothetical protein